MAEAPPAAPENYEAWANTSRILLAGGESITSELLAAIEGTDAPHPDSPKCGNSGKPRNVDRGPRKQKKLDDKLEVTKDAMASIESSIQRCTNIIHTYRHERMAKAAALKVVQWRLSLRERRPKSELFKDHLQVALEQELKTLEDSRKVLADRMADVKMSAEDCGAVKVRLCWNFRHMICEGVTNPPPFRAEAVPWGSTHSPASPVAEQEQNSALEDASPGEGSAKAGKRVVVPSDPAGLLRRAPELMELTKSRETEAEKLIPKQRVICDKANEKTMESFQKRTKENKEMRQSLEEQMREMDEAIEAADKATTRMKKDIEFFGKVELRPRVDATNAIVEKIRAAKQELADDLLRKVVSLRIDDTCRKITPENAFGQAPEDMPVAALLEGNGTKAKLPAGRKRPQLVKNASSPAFVSGNLESANSTLSCNIDSAASTATTLPKRPASPAGLSSPLKAAAAKNMGLS